MISESAGETELKGEGTCDYLDCALVRFIYDSNLRYEYL